MPESGNRERFEQLLTEQAYAAAWRHAYRLAAGTPGGRREDAEDLLQEALSGAYRALPQLRDPGRFTAWLVTIVHTRYLDWRRRRPPFAQADLPGDDELAPAPQDPLGVQVQEALELLPAAQREIISLFYIDGLSLKETGQVLRLAPLAVRQRLYRARRALKRQLELQCPAPQGSSNPASSKGVM
jgi:RNA polymerase sigma factor (sigma-70 family)